MVNWLQKAQNSPRLRWLVGMAIGVVAGGAAGWMLIG
jgi:hypothetical protein